jgi:alpha-glucoside transport system permease protein
MTGEDDRRPPPGPEAGAPESEPGGAADRGIAWLRVAAITLVTLVGVILFGLAVDYLRSPNANRLILVGVAIAIGVIGVFFLFWAMNHIVDLLPDRVRETARPYVFVGPALVILGVFLVYPVFNTILLSFKDGISRDFVGLDNAGRLGREHAARQWNTAGGSSRTAMR